MCVCVFYSWRGRRRRERKGRETERGARCAFLPAGREAAGRAGASGCRRGRARRMQRRRGEGEKKGAKGRGGEKRPAGQLQHPGVCFSPDVRAAGGAAAAAARRPAPASLCVVRRSGPLRRVLQAARAWCEEASGNGSKRPVFQSTGLCTLALEESRPRLCRPWHTAAGRARQSRTGAARAVDTGCFGPVWADAKGKGRWRSVAHHSLALSFLPLCARLRSVSRVCTA